MISFVHLITANSAARDGRFLISTIAILRAFFSLPPFLPFSHFVLSEGVRKKEKKGGLIGIYPKT